MKRKITALLMVLIMFVSIVTGCSLFEVDEQAYYEAVVGKITYTDGKVQEINKRELIMAYNSYGYNYVNNYGYTKEKAILETLETIFQQKLKIKDVELYYEKLGQPLFNAREKTYVWDTTYASIYNNLKEYYFEVTGEKPKDNNQQQQETNKSVYTPYESKSYLAEVNGKLVIKLKNVDASIKDSYDTQGVERDYEHKEDGGIQPDREAMYNKLQSLVGNKQTENERNWNSAFNKYLEAIKENYKYIKFASDKECFMFEMDRVYNILRDNYVVEKYNEIYNEKNECSTLSVDEILKSYSAKVRADYATYKNDQTAFESSMLTDVANMDYILNDNNSSNFFYVGYVKMEFDEEQKQKLQELKTAKENGSINDYDEQLEKLYKMTYATKRDAETGEKTNTTYDANTLRNMMLEDLKGDYLTSATAPGVSEQEIAERNQQIAYNKADAFRKYLYLYNDDDTLKGAERNTVFGVKRNGEVIANDTFKGNESATKAIKALYNDGNAKVGDLSELVQAEDGIYIFFYAGEIKNLFTVTEDFDASTREDNVKVLTSTRLNIFSEKTIFDKLFEEMTQESYSIFESLHINQLKNQLTTKIEAVKNNLKDLY